MRAATFSAALFTTNLPPPVSRPVNVCGAERFWKQSVAPTAMSMSCPT